MLRFWDVTVFMKNRQHLLAGEIADAFFSAVLKQAQQRNAWEYHGWEYHGKLKKNTCRPIDHPRHVFFRGSNCKGRLLDEAPPFRSRTEASPLEAPTALIFCAQASIAQALWSHSAASALLAGAAARPDHLVFAALLSDDLALLERSADPPSVGHLVVPAPADFGSVLGIAEVRDLDYPYYVLPSGLPPMADHYVPLRC